MKTLPSSSVQQAVLDAALELMAGRVAFAEMLSAGEHNPHVRVLARAPGLNAQMVEESARWRHLLSIRNTTTAADLRVSLPNNRARIANGLKMTSVFDWNGTSSGARALLHREEARAYHFGWAPMNLKIIDMSEVLLQGPDRDGHATVMAISAAGMLDAAMKYWRSVLATGSPAWVGAGGENQQFTPRQRRVLELMGQDLADQSIANLLGVSLRTVRYDIADILECLGVASRFAAGLRLGVDELA